jgi:hypothetical protein
MKPIRTLEDLVHTIDNSLSVISGQAQYLLSKLKKGDFGDEELQRSAALVALIHRDLGDVVIVDSPQAQ